jgi:hypothetical protein
MLNWRSLLRLTALVIMSVAAAGAQCGDQFVQVKTMCNDDVCYVPECQGTTYDVCQDATGPDKMCGDCDFFQAGICTPPGPARRGIQSLFSDPEEKALAPAALRSGCPLRGRILEEWIDESKRRSYLAQSSQRSGSPR